VASKQQVEEALRASGGDYRAAGAALGIPPGQAHLIATGLPADNSEGRRSALPSPLLLVNPAHRNPLRDQRVADWVRTRAARDLTPPR
jgi:hypothetical protein